MEKFLKLTFSYFLFYIIVSCADETNSKLIRNGNEYRPTVPVNVSQVQIGNKIWMARNLNVSTYRNGDPIPQVQDAVAWANLTTGAWCYHVLDTENGRVHSKLYNKYAVMDSRGLAPQGWHVARANEWSTLYNFLGNNNVGGKLKATFLWAFPNDGATNSSGFNALPDGFRLQDGSFTVLNQDARWWTSDQLPTVFYIYYFNSQLNQSANEPQRGLSVRCIKD